MIIEITQAIIDQYLRDPPLKRLEICDTIVRRFIASFNANGKGPATWYYRFDGPDGKTAYERLGTTDTLKVQPARLQAMMARERIAKGEFPADKSGDLAKKPKAEELTFAKFFEAHYYPFVVPRKRSHIRDKQLAVRVIKAMGNTKLSEISRLTLSNFHRSLLEEDKLAPSHCDGHIRFIKHALQLAVDWSMLEKNVASRFPLFNVDNRSNDFLTEAELQRFVQTVQASENKVISNLIMYMLATGMRLTEAMTLRYSEVNLETRTISIPARKSKSRRLKTIPISDVAVQAIQSQSARRGDSEFVWVNPKTGDRYKNINKAFDVLRKKANLPTFKIHGLRERSRPIWRTNQCP
ncbi:MAG: site-specific integrase [Burkholderiales bacterium]|nr:site-specific integrase [Burkholderiales bacterium]